MNDISAILLAAGRSRRMGAFKPLLTFGDRTVIECCLNNLRAAGVEDIVVVVGHRAEDIRAQLKNLDVTFAVNPDPDSEMSASIARGVAAVSPSAEGLIIALVDHPAVPSQTIGILIDEWRRGAPLVQPEHEGRGGHPVLVDLTYRNELLALDPESGLRALFTAHRAEVRRVPVSSPFVARDMDTWEDYQRLHQDVFGVVPAKD
ncbi:MAG: molybdenum cofactor cytidylyltransferase [Blastocatellia bacterium]|jgi:CTP:molybdopterin cytidylyltransferase MocA|nr:molybdenum cofactor cytidylyltransferase [Blastocatellia bacterium]